MNELISRLRKKGAPTADRLKRLYRRLSKRIHCMLAEPVQTLEKTAKPADAATSYPRLEVMKSLYRYASKFNGIETDRVFSTLLEQTRNYRPEIYQELLSYQEIFLRTYGE